MASSSSCDNSFSSNYMLLNPEDAGFWDVLKLLFSSNIGHRKFLRVPEGTREPFAYRWIIFVSIIAQEILMAFAKPLAFLGAVTEYFLNLVALNGGGFFGIIFNILTVRLKFPDRSSASFSSVIGLSDRRLDLGSKISAGDDRYYAALSIMASKVAYENHKYIENVVTNHWKMDLLGVFDFWNDFQEKATTQAFVMDDKKNTIVVVFRGTEPFDAEDWSTDLDMSWYKIPGMGKMHGGFMKGLGMQKNQGWPQEQDPTRPETAYYVIRRILKDQLMKNKSAKFIVTGHSLGGALAALFPAVLGLHEDAFLLDRLEGVYTFGQPRVGDIKFAKFMYHLMETYDFKFTRFVYSYDAVPRVPYDDRKLMFVHFGTCVYFNTFYNGKIVIEEPDNNYFSVIWMIPRTVTACWELVRSFGIKYVKGAEYEEGKLMRLMRVFGILVTGVSNHCPQDYVNSTRLASSDLFSTINRNPSKILKNIH